LLSGSPGQGTPVHAACFIRERRIVLEQRLLRYSRLLRLILIHEIFHFVWARLGNRKRAEFSRLLEREFFSGARGELGESASVKKVGKPMRGTRAWSDYVCESFCDTAAFVYSGLRTHAVFTLANRWANRRRSWFETSFKAGCRC
jgi:hypothetical protein